MSDKERAMKFLDNLLPDDVTFDKIQSTFNEDGSAVIITISNSTETEQDSD